MKAALNGVLNLGVLDGWWTWPGSRVWTAGPSEAMTGGNRTTRRDPLRQARTCCPAALSGGSWPVDRDDEAGDLQGRTAVQQPADDASVRERSILALAVRPLPRKGWP